MKKRTILLFAVGLILTGQVFADVVKKTKSEVNFTKFGKFTSVQSTKIIEVKKATDSDNNFKGKGIMGKLAGRFALKSGQTGEIIDLTESLIYNLDHKKKEYRVNPIQSYSDEEYEGAEEADVEEESGENESDVRIIRSEFKVDDTGEKKTINQFPSQKYDISWVVDWENVRTGQTGTNRLLTTVWTTPFTENVKECYEQEMSFSREHMKKLGVDMDAIKQDILGTNWLAMFTQMSDEAGNTRQDIPAFAKEMQKIEGYPVIIDGKYYATKQGGEEEEGNDEEEGGGAKKMLGGFAKKALKKSKKQDNNEPAFSYYTELIEFRSVNVGAEVFQVPSNYKKKG
ncbi:MAG: hypothetical protein OEY18_02170 [Candidatus Aminicenantes bacterium]|nr:hypothetical protein [Candidatus Aminicenantes bacterium]MDH5383487.1 hypothetical protein [Candidatus Aminicenantes bacterium]MDH5742797.1 hypothetical protein [Candidatus Aminicenantes bacterium]